MSYSHNQHPRFPHWLWWLIGAVTILAAGILILAVVLGIRAGQQQVEIQSRQQIGIHLQQAIDFRADGDLDAALAEYQRVLLLDPGSVAAVEGIESLLDLAAGSAPIQAAAAPTAVAESPLVQPTPTEDPLLAQWERAELAYSGGRWQESAEALERIQATDPAYRTAEVNDRLFNTYVNLAAEKDNSDNLEEALSYVDRALELRPDAANLRTARTLAAQYLDVLTYYGADWERAVEILEALYTENSGYRDVEERLQSAHVAWGDNLYEGEEWCDASDQYIAALDINVTPGLIAKRDQAGDRCAGAEGSVAVAAGTTRTPVSTRVAQAAQTDTTTPTAVATSDDDTQPSTASADEPATGPVGGPPAGRILYSTTAAADSRSRVFAQPIAGSSTPQMLIEDATQPALRADGERVIYVNSRDDMAGLSSYDPGTGLTLRFTEFAEDRLPAWSHDGNRVVFASNREGDRRWRIYVAWAETNGAITNLSFGEAPAWHPSDDQIAFRGCDESGNGCGIWTMNSGGGNRVPLTSLPGDTQPTWSPDGRYVVFMSEGRDGNPELYRVETGSGDVLRLTDHPAIDGAPTVSPDGSWVAFLSTRDGTWKIWGVPLSGGEAVMLANVNGDVGSWLDQNIQWIP